MSKKNFVQESFGGVESSDKGLLVTIATPGWGSSGYYSADVLQEAATNLVFPAGTLMYIDHDTQMESAERPEGSIKSLGAVLTENARWDGEKLVAPARTIHPWKETIHDLAGAIGASMRAAARFVIGEAEGRQGKLVAELIPDTFNSVDFVTRAGRGGTYVVLESAKVEEARNVGQYLESRLHSMFTNLSDEFYGEGRLTREERIVLSSGLGEALVALTARVESDAPQLFERDLWDEPVPASTVSVESQNSPVAPAGATKEIEEDATMATVQIEEAELTTLRESASRATALETENETLKTEVAAREAQEAESRVKAIVEEAFSGITADRGKAAVVAEALAGKYDAEQTKAAAVEAAAEYASAAGAGRVAGLGDAPRAKESSKSEPTDSEIIAALKGA